MRRLQAVTKVEGTVGVRNPLDSNAIGMAWEITVPVGDMRVRRARLIPGKRKIGDQGADAQLLTLINIRNLAHNEVATPLLDEVAFVQQPLEVRITIEQCA
ncbi:hypothetical protein D3C87_1896400 [compost metagenome]